MKISFRQGIVRYQTDINAQPTFLQRSTPDAQFIDLIVSPDPTIIAFAHRDADYLFEEVRTVQKAWGPFTGTSTWYLYWDINVLTGQLTRGATLHPPIYAGTAPSSPASDQHWFDTTNTLMKVWSGTKWIEKIRVFAGVFNSSAVIKGFALGTQAGLNVQVDTGQIVLDRFAKPLRQSDGSFLTTTVDMSVVGLATTRVKVESEILTLMANENIARFNCVQVRQGRTCVLAKSTNFMSRVSGVAMEDMHQGETANIVANGLMRSDTWSWPTSSINRPVFCGPTAALTLTPPVTGVLQQVGWVYDTDSIFVNIFPPIVLDNPDNVVAPPPPPPSGSPVPVISGTPTVGVAPLTVNFTNASLNGPFSLVEWDFNNDGTVDSTLPNPSYTYSAAGTYSVRLRVTNGVGTQQTVSTNYITVNPAPPTGTYTNLEVRFVVDGHEDTDEFTIKRGATFGVKLRVRNDGLLTATNVQRLFRAYDVGNQQVQVVSPPAGATVTRGTNYVQISFLPIAAMTTGTMVDFPPFTLRAPATGNNLKLNASVSSPEVDSTTSDNTRALTIRLVP